MSALLVGILLAGGKSSRMGSDKSCLKLNDKTLVSRGIELLWKTGCGQITLSSNVISKPELLANHLPDNLPIEASDCLDCIPDQNLGCGPLGGIHSCVNEHLNAESFLVVPVDMPLLTVNDLVQLAHHDRSAYFSDSPLPCLIKNSEHMREQLKTRLSEQSFKMSLFLETLQAESVKAVNDDSLINTNTPEEWRNMQTKFQTKET